MVLFHDISTIVGYLMPNPVFTYILNIWFINTFCRYSQLNDKTVQYLTIQFSINQFKWFQVLLCITDNSIKHKSFVYTQMIKQFNCKQFSRSHLFVLSLNVKQFYLFQIGPCQVLQLWVRVDLGAIAKKRYSTFPKVPELLEPHHQIV